ncbi:hypothetical protein [Azospirillum brasilense]|uniref:hypothetical protein n=1 Tax=Azospirillum brasilense TaxID=192 RepID=UPI001EDC5B75|nr:hypothetical protein [Azospirillum brasilense]UKJ78135.1 hypothetical protein H1Q64_32580 [Azospirillum brasilense]
MISIIVYGRNDHHGYNFHKRAAISLNCLAEMLSDPDDEILFADYNTSDGFPTLVEAIRDTLTERCRRLLRVFRIRPTVHERFRARTHLEVVEAVSRNTALRRSNPANRWIMSTNTDMIFVARDPGRSLSAIAAEKPDGFYHLPRFELPETLWESLDRRDPHRIIEMVRRWGTHLHLNEVVHTDAFARFDGIGDCQLVLRKDLFTINGFHEGMLVGWNVDMNLCRRLRHLYPETGSLLDDVFGYHCDHTRKPTAALSAAAIQNDPHVFINAVVRPDLPEQAETWGLPSDPVEEYRGIDLPADRFVTALDAISKSLDQPYAEARNDRSAYLSLTYSPEHVLPYAADHLSTIPHDGFVGFVGGSHAMLRQLAALWRDMGGRGTFLVLDSLTEDGVLSDVAEAVPLDRLHRSARILIFDFSVDHEVAPEGEIRHVRDLNPAIRDRLGRVKGAFNRLVAMARRDGGAAMQRKFVCLNAINTYFGTVARTELMFTWTPFTTRVCYGSVRSDDQPVAPLRSGSAMALHLETALGRGFAVDPWELTMLRADLAVVAASEDLGAVDPRCFTEPLLALLSWPGVAAEFGLPPEKVETLRHEVGRRRPSARLRSSIDPRFAALHAFGAGRVSLSKIAAAEDWEDQHWRLWAERLTREGLGYIVSTYNYFKRSLGVWERVQILYALDSLGALTLDARIAVMTSGPDGLPMFLADRVGQVDVMPFPLSETGPDMPESLFVACKNRFHDPERLAGCNLRPAVMGEAWDAIVITGGKILERGAAVASELLVRLGRLLRPGGTLVFSTPIEMSVEPIGRTPGLDVVLTLLALGQERAGLRPQGSLDCCLANHTLDRVAQKGTEQTARPHLVIMGEASLTTVAVLCLRKDDNETEDAEGG